MYKIMHWNPDFTYKIRGTFAERRGERIIVFNLVNAVPMMLVEAETADNERCRRIDLCPEEWDQDFGPEFYEHYLENGFYYIAPKTEWRSQAKSVHAFGNGTELSTAEQLQLTIDDLLRGTDSDNEN